MRRDLILIALAMFTWGLGEGLFIYFQPLYLQALGANPITIGTILGAMGVAMTIAHIPAGYLADKFGRRPILWASWFLGMVATWIMALGNTLPVFIVGMLMYGLTSFVMSPLNSYITTARGKFTVQRAITLISAAYNLGAISGPWVGGAIGDRVGLRPVYLASALVFVASNLVIYFIRPQPIDIPHSETKQKGLPWNRQYVGFLGIVFLAMFATYLPQPLSSNFLQNERGLTFSQIGRLGSMASLGIVVLNLILGHLDSRLGFMIGQATVGLFALLLWRGTGTIWFALGYFLLGGYRVARSLATAQARNLVHQANMGLAYGVTETVGSFAVIVAPLLAGYLYQQEPTLIYSCSFGLIIFSLLLSARFAPRRKTDPIMQDSLNNPKKEDLA